MRSPLRPLAALLFCVLPLAACSFGGSDSDGDTAAPRPKPSPTATAVPGGLGPEFFGVHDADPVGASWPKAPVGSLRIWDSGVAWNQVETAPGVYDWSRLDAVVKTARKHHAAPLIVLGQTPSFHSTKPKKIGAYGPGASSMPDLAAWTAYVQAVVERYNAPGVTFQVWNEANVEGYWSGTPKQMAQLTAAAREVVDAASPVPTLVSPALAVRTIGQRAWLRDFYAERVGGVPVADLADVLSLQLYPEAGAGPERGPELLAAARESLRLQGVPDDKPIWNTEINYGLQGGEPAAPAPPEQQQANVATTYLLNAAGGIGRVYWYSWDLHTIADTDMVTADNDTLTPGGEAFTTSGAGCSGAPSTPAPGRAGCGSAPDHAARAGLGLLEPAAARCRCRPGSRRGRPRRSGSPARRCRSVARPCRSASSRCWCRATPRSRHRGRRSAEGRHVDGQRPPSRSPRACLPARQCPRP